MVLLVELIPLVPLVLLVPLVPLVLLVLLVPLVLAHHFFTAAAQTLCQIVEPQGVLHIKPLFTFHGNVSPCTGTMSDPGLHFES